MNTIFCFKGFLEIIGYCTLNYNPSGLVFFEYKVIQFHLSYQYRMVNYCISWCLGNIDVPSYCKFQAIRAALMNPDRSLGSE